MNKVIKIDKLALIFWIIFALLMMVVIINIVFSAGTHYVNQIEKAKGRISYYESILKND